MMNEQHDRLQQRLERLEADEPLDAVGHGLAPGETQLIRLAAALRNLAFPALSAQQVARQRAKLLHAARKGQHMNTNPINPSQPTFRWRRLWPAAAAGLAAVLGCGLLVTSTLGGAMWLSRRNAGEQVGRQANTAGAQAQVPAVTLGPQQAEVRDVRGSVELQAADGQWQPVAAGHLLAAGQRLRTQALSSATLAFYDGSQARLGPSSEVTVDAVDAPDGGPRVVLLTQWTGESQHDVVPSEHPDSRYEVVTPSGSGAAKGTVFSVLVTPTLLTYFGVSEGAVAVTGLDVTVIVVAGQVTYIPLGQEPAEPVFRITGQGEVLAIGETWDIGGQIFQTHAETLIFGSPRVGDWVAVEARLAADGTRVADRIILLRPQSVNIVEFRGPVQAIGLTEWVIAGRSVGVDQYTQIDPGIEVNDLVEVTAGVTAEGVFWAKHIQRLESALPDFRFAGRVDSRSDVLWVVSGISVTVNAETEIAEELKVGDAVLVTGYIDDNTWLATRIEPLATTVNTFEFVGRVQDMDPWTVSGVTLAISDTTDIDTEITVGDLVKVEGVITAEGVWLAYEIRLFEVSAQLPFEFIGQVTSIAPWMVGGLPLTVDERTEIKGDITVGEMVKVKGWILADGTWLATEIKHTGLHRGQFKGCFAVASVVRSMEAGQIVLLDGTALAIVDGLNVEGELQVASVIVYTMCLNPSGPVTIVSIVVLYQLDEVPAIWLPPAPEVGEKVIVCHKGRTNSVNRSALPAHLGHGDTVGPCP